MQNIGALILIILMAVTLVALFLAIALLFPRRTRLTRQAAEEMPGRSFLLGLVNTLFIVALILGFVALADGIGLAFFYLPALGLLAVLVAALAFGLAGVVQLVGMRLLPEGSPNRRSIWGAVLLILGSLTPFVGWFGLFFYIGLLGLGAFVVSFFRKETAAIVPEIESE